jgi:hypothetical protein
VKVVRLFDGAETLQGLSHETVQLIHATKTFQAIKRLVIVNEILELNLQIQAKFAEFAIEPPWDLATLQDLNRIRRELIVYHSQDFNPTVLFDMYNQHVKRLLTTVALICDKKDLFGDI